MHECFANHDIRVFRDPYISSTGEFLTAAIPFETCKGTIWADGFTIAVIIRAHFHCLHIHHLYHIHKTIVLNNFKIYILITGCLFHQMTTSTIKWQWLLYFSAYSKCSPVKPFKPVQFLLVIFFCFMTEVILSETSRRYCVSNSAPSRNMSWDM